MKISQCETVVDEKKFIEAHTETIERHKDNWWFSSFKDRLNKYHDSRGNNTDSKEVHR